MKEIGQLAIAVGPFAGPCEKTLSRTVSGDDYAFWARTPQSHTEARPLIGPGFGGIEVIWQAGRTPLGPVDQGPRRRQGIGTAEENVPIGCLLDPAPEILAGEVVGRVLDVGRIDGLRS